jgi:hypothetical protein
MTSMRNLVIYTTRIALLMIGLTYCSEKKRSAKMCGGDNTREHPVENGGDGKIILKRTLRK